MLLPSPCFADASLAEISFHCSLEGLLRDRYKNPGMLTPGVLSDKIAHARYISMASLGKQLVYEALTAESFFLLKCI